MIHLRHTARSLPLQLFATPLSSQLVQLTFSVRPFSFALSVFFSWQREFEAWVPEMFVVSYAGNQRSRDAVRQFELGWEEAMGDTITRKDKETLKSLPKRTMRAHVIIASYQSLQSDIDFFQSVHWQVLIADEVRPQS